MTASRSLRGLLAGGGVPAQPARRASRARSIALSTLCQSAAARGSTRPPPRPRSLEILDSCLGTGEVTLIDESRGFDDDLPEQ